MSISQTMHLIAPAREHPNIVPRILCNKLGPSTWKQCIFRVLSAADISACVDEQRLPKKYLYAVTLTTLGYAAYLIYRCLTLPLPTKPCYLLEQRRGCNETPCQEIGTRLLFLAVVILLIPVVTIISFCIFKKIEPKEQDYEDYLMKHIQPLLDSHQFQIAYQTIFVSEDSVFTTTSLDIRESLCRKFIQKLVETQFTNQEVLDQLAILETADDVEHNPAILSALQAHETAIHSILQEDACQTKQTQM